MTTTNHPTKDGTETVAQLNANWKVVAHWKPEKLLRQLLQWATNCRFPDRSALTVDPMRPDHIVFSIPLYRPAVFRFQHGPLAAAVFVVQFKDLHARNLQYINDHPDFSANP